MIAVKNTERRAFRWTGRGETDAQDDMVYFGALSGVGERGGHAHAAGHGYHAQQHRGVPECALPRNSINDRAIRIVDVGGYKIGVFGVYRPKGPPQDANRHMVKMSEIYYILDGTGTLVTGGTMPDAKPMSPGSPNLQSPHVQGGLSRRVTKGDVVIIPGKTPHQWTAQDGDPQYSIFRTDPDSTMPLK